jgi:hypothetical protein
VIRVITAEAEELEDVLDGHWRSVGEEAERDCPKILHIHHDALIAELRQALVDRRRAAVA